MGGIFMINQESRSLNILAIAMFSFLGDILCEFDLGYRTFGCKMNLLVIIRNVCVITHILATFQQAKRILTNSHAILSYDT